MRITLEGAVRPLSKVRECAEIQAIGAALFLADMGRIAIFDCGFWIDGTTSLTRVEIKGPVVVELENAVSGQRELLGRFGFLEFLGPSLRSDTLWLANLHHGTWKRHGDTAGWPTVLVRDA